MLFVAANSFAIVRPWHGNISNMTPPTSSKDLPLDGLLAQMGQAGKRLTALGACEGAAGNISVCVRWHLEFTARFPLHEQVHLTKPVPELQGAALLVSGSGCRLGDIYDDPAANLGCLLVEPGGVTGQLYSAPESHFTSLTSELNTHLAVHYAVMLADQPDFNALLHAQPPYLTFLSHIDAYRDERYLNRRLLRWEPETIVQFPQGIGLVEYQTPGSPELAAATVASLHTHTLTLWSRHGVMSRSDVSVSQACDRIEYAEAAARYEYLNLAAGEPASGLSPGEIRSLCKALKVQQDIF